MVKRHPAISRDFPYHAPLRDSGGEIWGVLCVTHGALP
jgi:hypothetical protein